MDNDVKIDVTNFSKAATAKTMRMRANHIINGLWTLKDQLKLTFNKSNENELEIKPEDLQNIKGNYQNLSLIT